MLYGLLLVGSVLAFVVDRAGSGPQSAQAGTGDPGASLLVDPDKQPDFDQLGPDLAGPFMSDKRGHIESPNNLPLRDAFVMSDGMQRHYQSMNKEQLKEQQSEEERLAEQREQMLKAFRENHRLKATSTAGGETLAVIDDSVLRVGDRLDGFTLVEVDHYRAIFAEGDQKVELSLPIPVNVKVTGTNQR